jgi:hypothetical protein
MLILSWKKNKMTCFQWLGGFKNNHCNSVDLIDSIDVINLKTINKNIVKLKQIQNDIFFKNKYWDNKHIIST